MESPNCSEKKLEDRMEKLATSHEDLVRYVTESLEKLNQQMSSKNEMGDNSANKSGGRSGTGSGQKWSSSFNSFAPKTLKIDFPLHDSRDDPTAWTRSVIEYQCKFERLLAKAGALTQDRKVTCFITALKDSIRTDVQANHRTTLVMAIDLAKLFEARDQAQRRTNIPVVRPANPPRKNIGYKDRSSITTPTIKKMTTDELSERRKKGLCFHCNERYAPGHNCKKLFMIEASWEDKDGDVEMEIEGKDVEQSPEISLHAMAGNESPKTMRIWGKLMGQLVVAFIDWGSTHNFISSQTAQRINLHPNSNGRLEVMVALGEKLSTPGKCSNVQLRNSIAEDPWTNSMGF
ncbi:hypothetical protein Pint_20314 [Pistacia integerrima]|uniref:Uncharacterized protein n=1 Tax=Pistacia integerrima TaxID=434235 RepID=A0ACC0XDC3_9ROSI|nr:hypothetical protein Pint_20314 [Pistacia integerrima]